MAVEQIRLWFKNKFGYFNFSEAIDFLTLKSALFFRYDVALLAVMALVRGVDRPSSAQM